MAVEAEVVEKPADMTGRRCVRIHSKKAMFLLLCYAAIAAISGFTPNILIIRFML
jgi:hypothetical protein